MDPGVEQAADDLVRIREQAEKKRTRRLTTIGVVIIVVVLLMQGATLYFSYLNREEANKDRARITKINQDTRNEIRDARDDVQGAAHRATLGHRTILKTLVQLARQAGLDVSSLQDDIDMINGGGGGDTGGDFGGDANGSREEPPERPGNDNGDDGRPRRPPRDEDELCVDPPPPLPMICVRPIP